jgi:L-fuculose-phosphate aldolase
MPSNDANVSYRLGDGGILTLATGVYKDNIDEDMILELDPDGNMISSEGFYRPSADASMHVRIFKECPSMQGVINAQPPFATMCAVMSKSLDEALLPATAVHLGVVPVAPFALPGSAELSETVARSCKGHYALLLENRGLLVWADNLFEAYQRLETAEQYAMLTFFLDSRDKRLLTKGQTEKLLEMRAQYGSCTGGIPRTGSEGCG